MARDRFREACRRAKLRERIIAYMGGCCTICGYSRCASALDAHHVDDRTKDFNISDRRTWTTALQRELDKCHLLCSNCHREVHAGLHPGFLNLDDRRDYDEDDGFDQPPLSFQDG